MSSLSAAVPWVIASASCWFCYLLFRQSGRILFKLEAIERRLIAATGGNPAPSAQNASSLETGTDAPDFDLPDVNGGRFSLKQFRGRKLLLVFINPNCGFCLRMAPQLGRYSREVSSEKPLSLIVSTGPVEANRKLIKENGIECHVLRQNAMEIAAAYHVQGTPMGYLIDEQGKISSDLSVGEAAIMGLVEGGAGRDKAIAPADAEPVASPVRKANGDLSRSQIQRNGLAAGTPAPPFRLPCVKGGEAALEEYRGKRLLLVFSDPHCGPCNLLAPSLQDLKRTRNDFEILMISRGGVEENRHKIHQNGLTFPVALQKKWEISREYGIFSTPVAYMIDENGVIASEVAIGPERILQLTAVGAVA